MNIGPVPEVLVTAVDQPGRPGPPGPGGSSGPPPGSTGTPFPGSGEAAVRPDRDAELLRRHVAGDPDAFAELFRQHADRLWSVAFGLLRDADDAADAVQEAMLSAHRRAAGFRGEAQVGTWLYRIVTNAALDRLRRRAARPTVPMPTDPQGRPRDPVDLRDAIAERDIRLDVDEALGRLPPSLRATVVLVDVEGRPVAEVAELLDVPVGTVKSRCSRGRAQLAVLLGHLRPGNPAASPTVSEEGRAKSAAGVEPPPAPPSRPPGRTHEHGAERRPDRPEEVISNGD